MSGKEFLARRDRINSYGGKGLFLFLYIIRHFKYADKIATRMYTYVPKFQSELRAFHSQNL
jgi:hypothetical protein